MVEILWSGERAWLKSPLFTAATLALFAATLFGLHLFSGPEANQAWGYDFDAFYTGAAMTLEGRLVEAYDAAAFQEALFGSEDMYWMYPPHGAMLLAPMALLPYGAAAAVLLVGLAVLLHRLGACSLADPRGGALLLMLSVPGLFALLLGQVAPVFGALLCAALLCARTRPVLAGTLLALLTIKPQYGLLVPVILLVHRDWRTIAAACAGTAALVAASLLVFGPEAWTAWADQADGPSRDFIYDNLYASMPSVHHYVRFLGADQAAAGWWQGGALVLAAGLVAATRTLLYRRHVALTLLAACASMPYLWFYDWLPVMVAVLLLASGRAGAVPPRALLAAVWLAPLLSEVSEAVLLPPLPHSLILTLTNAVNLLEIGALWGLIGLLAYPAIRTTALPVFAPKNRPMKASGPLSSPS